MGDTRSLQFDGLSHLSPDGVFTSEASFSNVLFHFNTMKLPEVIA